MVDPILHAHDDDCIYAAVILKQLGRPNDDRLAVNFQKLFWNVLRAHTTADASGKKHCNIHHLFLLFIAKAMSLN